MAVSSGIAAQKTIPLYQGVIPNAISSSDEEKKLAAGQDSVMVNVSRPTLSIYLPEPSVSTGAAVVICPGGGYGSVYIDREGHEAARAFCSKGIAAFVLKYRLPSDRTMQDRTIGPLQDAQQAIKIVRQKAKEFNIDPQKVGIMGFSAGGHLAASAGVRFEPALIPNRENIDLRPDFLILVYPVITMDTAIGHKGSTLNLLGPAPSRERMDFFSHQLHVSEKTPPAFVTVAANDELLSSSLLFFDALHKKKVPAELHVYATGGHGFLKHPPFDQWFSAIINWLKGRKTIE